MGIVISWISGLFFKQEMELAIIGLQNAGKSTFVQHGEYVDDMIPTIGFNMHKIQKDKVQIKLWDLGGQQKFRGMWERYCRGVQVVIFMIDASDEKNFPAAKKELEELIFKVQNIPLLVLANKNDLPEAKTADEVSAALDLASIKDREVCVYNVSCKNVFNIDTTMDWILKHVKSA